MNREIKFRFWDKVDSRMKYAQVEYFDDMVGYRFEHRGFEEDDNSDIVQMQYTGLKDQNGKEIYEGDIVQTPCGHSLVEFSHGVFGLNHDFMNPEKQTMLGSWGQEHNLRSLDDGYYKNISVIGNIYQNN